MRSGIQSPTEEFRLQQNSSDGRFSCRMPSVKVSCHFQESRSPGHTLAPHAFPPSRYLLEEVKELDINSLELAAMNIGSFTIMAYAKARGFKVSHLYEFTDNTAAEHSAERGKPKSSRLGALIEQPPFRQNHKWLPMVFHGPSHLQLKHSLYILDICACHK